MTPAANSRRFVTPPELAARYGCKPSKVIGWIESGELRAVNLAAKKTGKRPRWAIREVDIIAFEEGRTAQTPVEPVRRKRQDHPVGFVEYFR